MATAFPKDLSQAEALVDGLSIDGSRVFYSTYGLDDTGAKFELKRPLLEYYRNNIDGVDNKKQTVHSRGISIEQQFRRANRWSGTFCL